LTYAQSDLLHSFLEAAYIGVDESGHVYEPEGENDPKRSSNGHDF
jgi:hypothetical protein